MHRESFVLPLLASSFLSAQSPSYQITHTYPRGGEGSWDYLVPDPAQHRVFIGRHDRVMVVDELTGKLLGEVSSSAWPPCSSATAFRSSRLVTGTCRWSCNPPSSSRTGWCSSAIVCRMVRHEDRRAEHLRRPRTCREAPWLCVW